MQCAFRANAVVIDSALVFELLTFEDKALVVGRYTCLIVDSCLDIGDGGEWCDIESDRSTIELPHKDLDAFGEAIGPAVDSWWWGDAGCYLHGFEYSMGLEFQMHPFREGDGYSECAAA